MRMEVESWLAVVGTSGAMFTTSADPSSYDGEEGGWMEMSMKGMKDEGLLMRLRMIMRLREKKAQLKEVNGACMNAAP
jgi:hypothetical protein